MRQPAKQLHPAPDDRERGYIEIGGTLAAIVIIILVIVLPTLTGTGSYGELFELWLAQPWWLMLLTALLPVAILLAGLMFESGRRWPKNL